MKSAKNRLAKSLGVLILEPSSPHASLDARSDRDQDAGHPGAAAGSGNDLGRRRHVWHKAAPRGATRLQTLRGGVIGHVHAGVDRGPAQASLRGGRSMGEVLCRGWGLERSVSSPVGSVPCLGGMMTMMHQESLVSGETGAGTEGRPCLREQPRPEQTGSGRGTVGRESTQAAIWSASDSRSERARSNRRPASEVTPCPQLARAGEGA
jgi:hypothetical protein